MTGWDRTPSEGEIFRTGGVKLAFKPLREEIPIWQGAVTGRGLESCSETADGWIPANIPAECIAWGSVRPPRAQCEYCRLY